MRLEKIMLIGKQIPQPLADLLLESGSSVTKVASGKTAVAHAHRELFDTAIIVSTGKEMDLAETVFNLRDVNGSMQVIILADCAEAKKSAIPTEAVVRFVRNTKIMSMQELKTRFELSQRRYRGKRPQH